MTKFVSSNKLSASSVRVSAPGADIIPKVEHIRTRSADMNELDEIAMIHGGNYVSFVSRSRLF